MLLTSDNIISTFSPWFSFNVLLVGLEIRNWDINFRKTTTLKALVQLSNKAENAIFQSLYYAII